MLTVSDVVTSLGFDGWILENGKPDYTLFSWPPDVFALAATLLQDSGAYLQAARPHSYPDGHCYHLDQWLDRVQVVADEWRLYKPEDPKPPEAVCELLDEIAQMAEEPISSISRPDTKNLTWVPLVALVAFADQASRGAGSVFGGAEIDEDDEEYENADDASYPEDSLVSSICMDKLLQYFIDDVKDEEDNNQFQPITLCHRVDPTRAIVLPKMRTSQRGATIRSLSLYLSLLTGTDIEPRWHSPRQLLLRNQSRPNGLDFSKMATMSTQEILDQVGPYNIILYPWPFHIRPTQFEPLPSNLCELGGRPADPSRFFSYSPQKDCKIDLAKRIQDLIKKAEQFEKQVHGLVLPEMAVTRQDFDGLFGENEFSELDFVACGVHEGPADGGCLGRNYTMIRYRNTEGKYIFVEQEKHHRWALDSNQVKMYGLSTVLNPDYLWWEGIALPRRSLNFFSLDAMVAYTVLVCEDLARPDPVANGIRAIGPNLVICLLMDGPQLVSRWSARYATVLADDPGSSVITLSSLGMVRRSRLRDKLHRSSRTVALWREPGESPCELELEQDSEALLVSLYASSEDERTIDGRSDGGVATVLRLSAVHQLGLPTSGADTAGD